MKSDIDLKDFRLVVSDLDGTLLNDNQTFHPLTKEVFKELEPLGVLFTLASGRSLHGLRRHAAELNVKIPMILSNGCIIQSMDGQIHHRSVMPVEITRKVFEIADREESDLVVFLDDTLLFKTRTPTIERIFGHGRESVNEMGSWENLGDSIYQVNKMLIMDWFDLDRLDEMERIFSAELDSQADYLRTSMNFLEVMPKGISKATGLKFLIDDLGIRMDEVLAFGDYDNDVEMLEAAGFGAAVANASDSAKEKADLIIGSCAENGPAVFLNDLINQAFR